MDINSEIKQLNKLTNKEEIEKNLIKNIIKFLGGENSPLRSTMSLSNEYEIDKIKNDLLIQTLKISRKEANNIIKNVLSSIKNYDSIQRVVFYYLTLKELNSPEKTLKNIHPGEVLLEEFLKPLEISAYRLSKDIGVPQTRISLILKGERGITADTALRLSKYFGTSSKFWLGLQNDYDLEESKKNNILDLTRIKKCA